jgi:predicted enzyme related to lactoylglutathione lyase
MSKSAAFVLMAALLGLAGGARAAPGVAVGAQYDSTHVYVASDQMDRFAASFVATFGGQAGKAGLTAVTPTPSSTLFQPVLTPAGILSVFGFQTPIPYPFGDERTGYLVTDMDAAVAAARKAGAELVVAPFPDPIGRDAVIRWPGGVYMQLYWHTTPPSYAPLATVPDNRVYVSADAADAFVRDFDAFSGGHVTSDDAKAPGIEIGRPGDSYRRIRLDSGFGKLTVLVTNGYLPWPYGREITGYAVTDLPATLAKAKAAGVQVLAGPYGADGRDAAMVQFPGGYIAEIHAAR